MQNREPISFIIVDRHKKESRYTGPATAEFMALLKAKGMPEKNITFIHHTSKFFGLPEDCYLIQLENTVFRAERFEGRHLDERMDTYSLFYNDILIYESLIKTSGAGSVTFFISSFDNLDKLPNSIMTQNTPIERKDVQDNRKYMFELFKTKPQNKGAELAIKTQKPRCLIL